MSRVRKIVTEHVAVGDLPESVRGGLDPRGMVRVILETIQDAPAEPRYLKFMGIAAHKNTSIEDAVARVRALRDEWD